jgi:hypothetical protein
MILRSTAMFLVLSVFCYATPKSIVSQDGPKKDTIDVNIPDGTELTAVLEDEISSASATEGDAINFRVKDDVKIDGKTVIAKGTLVKGTIANAQKAARMGKGGKLGIRVESTSAVDGQKVRLRASKGGEGGDKVGTVIALSVFFGLFGLLKKGKNAKIKAGTEIKTYTDEAKMVKVSPT